MQLAIRDLSKTYPNGTQALKNVSLDIPQGMFGLLGPNGAGKSTLMRIIATLQDADEGSMRLGAANATPSGDIDVLRQKSEVRKTLGYLPQSFGFYPNARAERLLEHFAVLKGIAGRGARRDVVEALLQQTNLWDVRKHKLGTFSGGMRQRFGVAVALVGNPKLIIVDEPTAGLDPAERVRFLNLLSEIGEDSIVILSTHIVEDVEELCTRMAIIGRGEILLEAETAPAIDRLRGRIWRRSVSRGELPALEREQAGDLHEAAGGTDDCSRLCRRVARRWIDPVEPDLKDRRAAARPRRGHRAQRHADLRNRDAAAHVNTSALRG